VPGSRSSSNFCTMKSCRCRTAHVGKQKAVAGAGTIREQVASERATCSSCYSCCSYCFAAILFIITLHLDCLVLGWAYFRMGWAYFQERGFSIIRPPPSLSSHLSSSPMGVLLRDYGTFFNSYSCFK